MKPTRRKKENLLGSIKLDEELDKVKEILDRIEGELKEEIKG